MAVNCELALWMFRIISPDCTPPRNIAGYRLFSTRNTPASLENHNFLLLALPASDIHSRQLLGPCIQCAPLFRLTYAKRLTKVTGWLTVTVEYHHIQFQNINSESATCLWEEQNFLKGWCWPRASYGMATTDPVIWPFFLSIFCHEYVSANAGMYKKKILRNISHQSISHRKVQESKYLSGINHSACHIVEVKTVRTSGGEDPYVLNAQAISVIFQLPISAKSRVQVIFGSQYI